MSNTEIIVIADCSQNRSLTLAEVCVACSIKREVIDLFIEHDIVHPQKVQSKEWLFDLAEVKRLKRAVRLQKDLEINLSGVALVLNLLDEIEGLRVRTAIFEKHFFKL